MRSRKRPSSFAYGKLEREFLRYLGDIKPLLLKVTLIFLLISALPFALGTPAYLIGVLHAGLATSLIAIVAAGFLLYGEGALLIAGTYGEAYSQEELASAAKAGSIFGAVHNIEVRLPDIDSLVLAASGIYAIETKWRFGRPDQRWLAGAVEQANEAARSARLVLLSKGLQERSEVQALLVVWGGAARDLAEPTHHGSVVVMPGRALTAWLVEREGHVLEAERAQALLASLRGLAEQGLQARLKREALQSPRVP